LQEDVQRFTGGLIERTGQAALEIEGSGKPDEISTEALRRALNYESAALDLASQPLPEVAVLDMLVFLRLNRRVIAEHWIPQVFGERGKAFLLAFEHAEQQFGPIADKILSASQRESLIHRVDEWRTKNPDFVLVEFVRLTDLSTQDGSVAVARPEEVRGMLASVKNATQAADHAILLGESALFLANKLPFLVRHQVRLGSREVARDAMDLLSSSEAVTESLKNLQPLIAALPAVEAGGLEVAREYRFLAKEIQSLVPTGEQIALLEQWLEVAKGITRKVSGLVEDVRKAAAEEGPNNPLARVARRADATMGRALGYLIVLGASWSIAWWGCYALAKRIAREGR
jgi:hypothetical protein